MNDTKIVSLFLVVMAATGLWLHSQRKLLPVVTIVFMPGDKGTGVSLGKFAVALIVYLLLLSFLDPQDGLYLTVIVILGALLVNHQIQGKNDVISTILQ